MYVQQTEWVANYDESQIPPYTLPELLRTVDGREITNAAEWEANRPALLQTFRDEMYGRRLPKADKVEYTVLSEKNDAVDGLAIRREIELKFIMDDGRTHSAVMLLYIPAGASGPVPVFTGLTFGGNHVVSADEDIRITGLAASGLRNFPQERGAQTRRFPLSEIMKRNFALAVCSYHDFFPDSINGWEKSIFRIFVSESELAEHKNMTAIGAWAWGISRMLDYLETLPEIDSTNAAVFGHSRLGKTSLWCGAEDTRFKLVCVNDSGCGGAAPSRRLFGETLFFMCHATSLEIGNYWFTHTVKDLAITPEKLSIDQHQLVALIAPRSVAVHSATEDLWADPKGEYLSTWLAGPVYAFYGKKPLESEIQPPPETPVGTDVSYFLREGKHDMLLSDWLCYMDVFDHTIGR